MNKKDVFKVLIPVVAVVIIIESIMMVGGIGKKQEAPTGGDDQNELVKTVGNSESNGKDYSIVGVVDGEEAKFVFTSPTKDMKVGESYDVTLSLLAKKDLKVDAFDIFVNYDPAVLKVESLTKGERMPAPTFDRISEKTNLIVANYWINSPEGLKVSNGEVVDVMRFKVTPQVAGETMLGISGGNSKGDSVTVVASSNNQNKKIIFSSDSLNINVIE